MGATGWQYFVPYQADIAAALQRLREDVFARGEYSSGMTVTKEQLDTAFKRVGSDWESNLDFFSAQAADPKLPQATRDKFATLANQLKQLHETGKPTQSATLKPRTIDELLESRAENGTHSILDIVRVSPTPELGAVAPLPKPKLVEMFGSETPTRSQIEQKTKSGALESYTCERWQGIYIVVYQNAVPAELFFAGCSGD
jgi:hypothetical protein